MFNTPQKVSSDFDLYQDDSYATQGKPHPQQSARRDSLHVIHENPLSARRQSLQPLSVKRNFPTSRTKDTYNPEDIPRSIIYDTKH